ncbi:MAG: outer membrane beta-barrel protein [Ignavibacteria bacterium]|nr:outer membrane beta-barrel protein [Ignavibacteria bacterium]MBT8382884.1 outer membrane beta-barrel protein [Ignavibacteria bacterium]MBT8390452.1 outer membrane beta-barrel protein [Ignavibacteria bacterium]NNJ52928.1 outer membrane beta-barrel protein [Ignavibacteriaceae bacterium]NNL21363.1 outer membrane beta-barrel protein [Ignavibacteriaceae bacterium]
MKTFVLVILIFFSSFAFINAQNKMAVGAGLIVSLPMGDFGDAANTGFGGTAAFELIFMPQLVGVGQIGYIVYGTESDAVDFSTVPVQVGVKYFFVPTIGFYGIGQIGLNFFSTTVEIPQVFGFGGGSVSESSSKFTLVLGAGYEVPVSPNFSLDFSGTFNLISDFNNIQVRAGGKIGL